MNTEFIQCPIREASSKYPSNIAIRAGNKTLTYLEVEQLVSRVAASLKKLDFPSNEIRLGIFSKNSFELAAVIFAAQRVGISLVFLNTRLQQSNWEQQLELSGVDTLLYAEELESEIAKLELKKITIESLFASSETFLDAKLQLDRESCVIFTSGSSGAGKGVRLSVRSHISSAKASNKKTKLQAGDTWLVSLPLYHVGGLEILYRTCCAAACALLDSQQGAKRLEHLMSEYEITHVSFVPSQLSELLALPKGIELCRKLKVVLLGGAPTDSSLIKQLIEQKLPAKTSYGMSETASHISMMGDNPSAEEYTASGSLLDDMEIKLVDADGQEVARGQKGEILLRGEHLFLGYIGQAQREADEWFATGDAGAVDSKGNLKVFGRIDNTIISGGENINPRVIEDTVKTFSSVKDCAVVSVADKKWGHRPKLFVEWFEAENKGALKSFIERELPKIMFPKEIISLDKLPRTAIGKIDYKLLRAS